MTEQEKETGKVEGEPKNQKTLKLPWPTPQEIIVICVFIASVIIIAIFTFQQPAPPDNSKINGTRNHARRHKRDVANPGQVGWDVRNNTLWFNSSNTYVATYTFCPCDMVLLPEPDSVMLCPMLKQQASQIFICVTGGQWGNDCGSWGSVGWNSGEDWGYTPDAALSRKDKNGIPLKQRMSVLYGPRGDVRAKAVINIINPSEGDTGKYIFGLYMGTERKPWYRTFYLRDVAKDFPTNPISPSLTYSIVRAIGDPTYEDTIQIETGYSETNFWLEWMRYTANKHNMSDCYVCAGARPHLGTVPLTLPEGTVDCFLSIYTNGSNSTDKACDMWRREYPITTDSPQTQLPVTVYKGNYTCFNGSSTGGNLKTFPPGYCASYGSTPPDKLQNQTLAIGDIYWLCGDMKLRPLLPRQWKGECALAKILMPIHIFKEKTDGETSKTPYNHIKRNKREIPGGSLDPHVYIDPIGVPRGVPDEFKARNQIWAGVESIIPQITINKNVDWINYIYYNQQRFVNYTRDAIAGIAAELGPNSKMTFQNRMMLDMIMAEKGGVCHMLKLGSEECCTFIPNNTGPDGRVTKALQKLSDLSEELKRNSGVDTSFTGWLEGFFGSWKQALKMIGIMLLLLVIIIAIIACCVAPLIKRMMTKMMLFEQYYADKVDLTSITSEETPIEIRFE